VSAISHIDLCFVIDCTNSMGPFIAAAQQQTQQILTELAQQAGADVRCGVVGYRDHGHAGEVVDVLALSGGHDVVKAQLARLVARADGNPDAAEAVFAGLVAAVGLRWRESAMKVIVLVGDAPPHGCGAAEEPFPDRFAEDPTGQTLHSISAEIERNGITLYSLVMAPSVHPQYDQVTADSFGFLARSTGGVSALAGAGVGAITVLETLGRRAFGDLVVDRRVFEVITDAAALPGAAAAGPAPAPAPSQLTELATTLKLDEGEVVAAIARLQKRKLVQ